MSDGIFRAPGLIGIDNRKRVAVPCAGCTACCKAEQVILFEEHGDKPETYETDAALVNRRRRFILKRKANGECCYLGTNGCIIHHRAPAQCRTFDCRRWYTGLTHKQRKELAEKHGAGPLLDAAEKRLGSLVTEKIIADGEQ